MILTHIIKEFLFYIKTILINCKYTEIKAIDYKHYENKCLNKFIIFNQNFIKLKYNLSMQCKLSLICVWFQFVILKKQNVSLYTIIMKT